MIADFTDPLFAGLTGELKNNTVIKTSPGLYLKNGLALVRTALTEIREYIRTNPFADMSEEVRFFKFDKPRFLAEELFLVEIYTIETTRPLTTADQIHIFYEQELRYIKRFFVQNQFMYQYYQLGASDLDNLLFLRGVNPPGTLLPLSPGADPAFSAAADYLFARFMAFEMLQDFLVEKIYEPFEGRNPVLTRKGRVLTWTGDKSNLIELAYGLYDTMQVNEGEADLSEIVEWLERSFQVSLGRYYQVFAEIRSRKTVSKTRFIDHMKTMLEKHMEDADAFRPEKPRPVSGSREKKWRT